jgi:hypothetical protein
LSKGVVIPKDGYPKIYSAKTGKLQAILQTRINHEQEELIFAPDCAKAVLIDKNGEINFLDCTAGGFLFRLKRPLSKIDDPFQPR